MLYLENSGLYATQAWNYNMMKFSPFLADYRGGRMRAILFLALLLPRLKLGPQIEFFFSFLSASWIRGPQQGGSWCQYHATKNAPGRAPSVTLGERWISPTSWPSLIPHARGKHTDAPEVNAKVMHKKKKKNQNQTCTKSLQSQKKSPAGLI